MGRRRRFAIGSGVFVAVIAVALAAGIWYAFFRADAPAPVSIDAYGTLEFQLVLTQG